MSLTRSRPSALTLIDLAVFADFVCFGLVFPILPLYAHERHLALGEIGLLLSTYSLAQVVAAPLWGRVSDTRGRRGPLVVALMGTAVSAFLIAAAHSATLLFVAVALNGCSGGSLGIAQAAITDVVPESDRPRALGHLGAFVALGFILGPALAALTSTASIALPFVLAGALAAANALVAFVLLTRVGALGAPVGVQAIEAAPPAANARRAVIAALITYGLLVCAFAGFEASFGLIGRKDFGFGNVGAGWSFAALGIVLAAVQGRAVRPVLARLGSARTITFGVVALCAGLALLVVRRDFVVLALALALIGVGYGLCSPVLTASLAKLAPAHRRGRALSVVQSASAAARIVGPALAGLVLASSGARWTALTLALLGALAVTWFTTSARGSTTGAEIRDSSPADLPSPENLTNERSVS